MKRRIKAIFSIFLCLLMISGNVALGGEFLINKANAAELTSGECGSNVSYSFNRNNGTLTISGSGMMEDYDYSLSPFYDNSAIKAVIIEKGVTSIGRYAFPRCRGLSVVSIPESVESIGEGAFSQCTGFSKFTIPESVYSIGKDAFRGCTLLKKIFIPRWVLSIGKGAFSECTGLKEIVVDPNNEAFDSRNNCNAIIRTQLNKIVSGCSKTVIPESIAVIGEAAFYGITEIESIIIPISVASIETAAFYNCTGLEEISIPNTVKSIEKEAFSGCSSLREFSFPSNITEIPDKILSNCTALSNIAFASGTVSIGASAFLGCTGLTEFVIPSSVSSIGEYAFYQCTGISQINIPANVSSIGKCAFSKCTSLTSLSVDINNNTFDSRFDCNAIVRTATNSLMVGCASTVIYDGITGIGEYAFYQCTGLTSISIPNSVKAIGSNAFGEVPNINYSGTASGSKWGADNLNRYAEGKLVYLDSSKKTLISSCKGISGEVVIPNSVTKIEKKAFENRCGITDITISGNVTNIGDNAFAGCTGLKSLVVPDNVMVIGEKAFYGCSGLKGVELSLNLESIGEEAFCKCTGVTSITIPDGVEEIGSSAFEEVLNIVYHGNASGKSWGAKNYNGYVSDNIVYSDSSKRIIVGCGKSISGDLYIPDTVRNIVAGAFNECYGITDVYVSSENPEYDSRSNCNAIIHTRTSTLIFARESTVIPDDVTCIAAYAFNACKGLTSINLPESIAAIDEKAFYGNSELKSINFPEGLETIGEYAFYNCRSLTDISLPESIKSIGKYAFCGCSGIEEAVIPNGVKSIKAGTFSGCVDLTKITIPNSITAIENKAFEGCASLEDVYYSGTFAQRRSLLTISNSKGENNAVVNANWHYLIPEALVVSSMPEKTVYLENESIDITGLEVTAVYSDGFSEILDDIFEYSPKVTNRAGEQMITVSYMGKTAKFAVTVEHSFTHYKYNNDARVGVDGTETAKCDNCDETHTRTLPQTAKPGAVYFIRNKSSYDGKTIDYRASLRITAEVLNCTSIEWHVSGASFKNVSERTIIIEEAKSDFTAYFTAKDFDGRTVTSETETVRVKQGFFDKLIAFFKGLFKTLPMLEQ